VSVLAVAPPPAADWFAIKAQLLANALAARYGGPVYLVGSALALPDPHDFDLRVVLAEVDMARLFGRDDATDARVGIDHGSRAWRRMREQLKQSRRFSRLMRVNIDLQVQTAAEALRYADRPLLRLDRAPAGFFAAGLDDA
jgi:hypothetical protein